MNIFKCCISASVVLAVLLCGCDPIRTVQIRPQKEDRRILVYLKSTDVTHVGISSPENPIDISLRRSPEFRQHYSIGKWDSQSIHDLLVNQIDSIVIFNGTQKKSYRTATSLQKFLESKRQTFSKHVILLK